jgi:hypothetical protein
MLCSKKKQICTLFCSKNEQIYLIFFVLFQYCKKLRKGTVFFQFTKYLL